MSLVRLSPGQNLPQINVRVMPGFDHGKSRYIWWWLYAWCYFVHKTIIDKCIRHSSSCARQKQVFVSGSCQLVHKTKQTILWLCPFCYDDNGAVLATEIRDHADTERKAESLQYTFTNHWKIGFVKCTVDVCTCILWRKQKFYIACCLTHVDLFARSLIIGLPSSCFVSFPYAYDW